MRMLLSTLALLFTFACATVAPAATCSTSQATFSVVYAYSATCVSGDNDLGANGYFASDPTLFGKTGWMLGHTVDDKGTSGDGVVSFFNAPDVGDKFGLFGVRNPSDLSYAVVLKAGNGFAVFDMGTLDGGYWSSSKNLSHASVWYTDGGTPTSPVPLPAGGLLLLGGLGVLALRKRFS